MTADARNPARVGLTALLLTVGLGVAVAGCGTADTGRDPAPPASSATSEPTGPSGATSRTSGSTTEQENRVQIEIVVDDQRFRATLDDSAATRDLLAQLPLTVDMVDHGSVEKTGALPSPLSLDGQPDGADPDVGDIGYYAPDNDLVLYYGDQSYYRGIVILGRLDAGAADRLAGLDGAVTVTVQRLVG